MKRLLWHINSLYGFEIKKVNDYHSIFGFRRVFGWGESLTQKLDRI